MDISWRSARLILAVAGAVVVAATAVLVVPGLAGAGDGGGVARNVPEAAPVAVEPAVGSVSAPAAVGPGSMEPVPAVGPTEPAPSIEPDRGARSGARSGPPPAPVTPGTPAPAAPRAENPDAPVSSPPLPYDPTYWTPERMADAKPMPMPTVP